MTKFKREYEWKGSLELRQCVGLGFAIGNEQPKKKYHTAWWELNVLFICWHFSLRLSYNYKN